MSKHKQTPPLLEQPELPNMPEKPPKTERVYKVSIIEAKKRIYCRVDYDKSTEPQNPESGEIGEIFTTVRQLENILNKLKKQNIILKHNNYEQHYNTTDIHSSHPGN